jgi:hypothetical protein
MKSANKHSTQTQNSDTRTAVLVINPVAGWQIFFGKRQVKTTSLKEAYSVASAYHLERVLIGSNMEVLIGNIDEETAAKCRAIVTEDEYSLRRRRLSKRTVSLEQVLRFASPIEETEQPEVSDCEEAVEYVQ